MTFSHQTVPSSSQVPSLHRTADEKALSKPNIAAGSEAETVTAPGENAGEHVLLVAEFFPDRIGQNRITTGLASPDAGAVGQLHDNELLRLLHRNGAQAERIDQLKNGRIRANSQGDR